MMMDCMLSFIYALPDNLPFFFFFFEIYFFLCYSKEGRRKPIQAKGIYGIFFFFYYELREKKKRKGAFKHASMFFFFFSFFCILVTIFYKVSNMGIFYGVDLGV